MKQLVLVVEDDATTAALVERVLRMFDCNVIIEDNGASGLRTALLKRPTLVITDLMLPDIDGWELARTLNDDPHWQDVPIIAMSAWTSDPNRNAAFEAGCVEFVSKPFNMDELKTVLSRYLTSVTV